MKQIKISEQQDREIRNRINENLNINAGVGIDGKQVQPVLTTNEPVKDDSQIMNTLKGLDTEASKLGIDQTQVKAPNAGKPAKTVSMTTPDSGNEVKESFIISMKQLNEMRLRKLKENSQVVKIEKFLK